jgi:hypothetical protein
MKANGSILKQHLALLMSGFLFNLTAHESLRADEPAVPPAAGESCFDRGALEGTFNEGILFSPFLATHNRPTLNYELTEISTSPTPTCPTTISG